MILNKQRKLPYLGMILLIALGTFAVPAQAQQAPAKLQAALFLKLLGFYQNLGKDPFAIHVVGAPDVASELKKLVGQNVGKAKLSEVSEGTGPPSNGAKVIYVGSDPSSVTGYSQSNNVLTITGIPELVNQGVTLGVKIEAGKPKILLNLSSTKAEGVNWNPAILKVASTVD
jgi:hypothetical protein